MKIKKTIVMVVATFIASLNAMEQNFQQNQIPSLFDLTFTTISKFLHHAEDYCISINGNDVSLVSYLELVQDTLVKETFIKKNFVSLLKNAPEALQYVELKHSGAIGSIALSSDGTYLAVFSHSKIRQPKIKVWNIADHTNISSKELQGDISWITSLSFTPDNKYLVANCNGTIYLWDISSANANPFPCNANNSELSNVSNIEAVVNQHAKLLAFSKNNKYLAINFGDSNIDLWSTTDSNKCIAILHGHLDLVESVVFSPDSKYVATSSKDKTVRLWNIANIDNITAIELKGHIDIVETLTFSSNGKYLAALDATDNSMIYVWSIDNFATHDCIRLKSKYKRPFNHFLFDPKDTHLAAGLLLFNYAYLWNLHATINSNQIRPIALQHGQSLFLGATPVVKVSLNENYVATCSHDEIARIWDISDPNNLLFFELMGHAATITEVLFGSQGNYLFTGSNDGIVRIWLLKQTQQKLCKDFTMEQLVNLISSKTRSIQYNDNLKNNI